MTTTHQYFSLQLSMLKRQIADAGLKPQLGFIIILPVFYAFSFYLFAKTPYARYLYALMALSLVTRYSAVNRNDFLKFIFPKMNYYKTRILENLITVTPFIFFLCFKKDIYTILLLVLVSILLAFMNNKKQLSFTIPTPFYKTPFEFIVGFRASVIIIFIAYFLAAISVIYQNFNLGIFSLLLVFLTCLSFFNEPENEFYVWIYKLNANGFLLHKIKTAIVSSTLLCLPVTAILIFFFKTHLQAVLVFQCLGYCYLGTMILAKYAAYPQKINLLQGILFSFCFAMPPALLAVSPYFFIQAKKRLKEILND
jgi:hypothetical protein